MIRFPLRQPSPQERFCLAAAKGAFLKLLILIKELPEARSTDVVDPH